MQPIPLKRSAPPRCYFLFATLMFSSNPLLFLSLSFSLSISFFTSLSILLVPLDQSPLHPVVPRSRLIVRNLWYGQTFSTVFAVSFLFIPSTLLPFFFPPFFFHSSLSRSLFLSSILSLPLSLFPPRFVHQSADWISTAKMRPY